jgi:hypothetical protein
MNYLTETVLHFANTTYVFVGEFTFHLQRNPELLPYFIKDFWMGNY